VLLAMTEGRQESFDGLRMNGEEGVRISGGTGERE